MKRKVTRLRKAEVLVERVALDYMLTAARAVSTEIGGLFVVENEGEGVLRCHSPSILKQEASGGNFVFEHEAQKQWFLGQGFEFKERMPYFSFGWWHSHVNMDVYLSATDEKFIAEWATRGPLVSIVVNKKGEVFHRVDAFTGEPFNTKKGFFTTIPSKLKMASTLTEEEMDAIEKEAEDKVEQYTWAPQKGSVVVGGFGPSYTFNAGDHPLLDQAEDGAWIWPKLNGEYARWAGVDKPFAVCGVCGEKYQVCTTKKGHAYAYATIESYLDKVQAMLLKERGIMPPQESGTLVAGGSKTTKSGASVMFKGRNGEQVLFKVNEKVVRVKDPGGTLTSDLSIDNPTLLVYLEGILKEDDLKVILGA